MKASRLAAVVIVSLFLALGSATAAPQQAKPSKPAAEHGDAAAMLKQDMRKLWTDHVVWTRDYVIAAVANQPDADAALNRLMKNQEDIGHAVAKFYGNPAGQQLTTLLKQHIEIAGHLIQASKIGDGEAKKFAYDKWQQNAVDIADFLSKANPNWPRATLVDMMKKHLATTRDEVVARLTKNWDADVRAYDAVYEHILHLSDALSDGIVKQFPDKFGAAH